MKRTILISACLLGLNVKYTGDNNLSQEILSLINNNKNIHFIPVCPEILGGLPTPREAAGLTDNGDKVIRGAAKVLTQTNKDITEKFIRGAYETLKIAKLFNADAAILKEGSPSCGSNITYNVSGKFMKGMGVTAVLLKMNKVEVYSEENIETNLNKILGR